MNNEVKEIAGFKIKDETARNRLNKIDQQTVNIINYSSDEDKTQAINEIISENNVVYISNGEIIKADNSCFTKEKFEKFIRSGKYLTNTVANNADNKIQARDISKCPHAIYRDMIFPSECVNAIKWAHQKQSWLWQEIHWNMTEFSAIVPWFQFSKNPNYEGEVPNTFNIFIGKYQVLAYDISKKHWVEVYNGMIENCAYYNYYEGATDNNSGNVLTFNSALGDYRKYSINYSDINTRVLHGWLGTSEDYIPTNSNYKYLAVRLSAYTDAPHGYLTMNLGLDLKGGTEEKPIQEIAGSRTSFVTNEPKYYYLSNVEPENYDKYLSEDTFEIIRDLKTNASKETRIARGYIANNTKTYKLSKNNAHYLVAITNLGSGNVSSAQVSMVSTGNGPSNTGLVTTVVAGNIADITVNANVLTIAPKTGCYVNCSIILL